MVHAPARFDTVLDRIRAFAAARGWKPARLAREANLSDTTTRGMERDDWLPSGSTIRALESLIAPGWSPGEPLPETAERTGAQGATESPLAEEASRPAPSPTELHARALPILGGADLTEIEREKLVELQHRFRDAEIQVDLALRVGEVGTTLETLQSVSGALDGVPTAIARTLGSNR